MPVDMDTLAPLLFVISPLVGWALCLVIDRLPRNERLFRNRSTCRACGSRLTAVEQVPLFAFFRQAGRCRSCGHPIPRWLAALELLCPIAAALAIGAGGVGLEVLVGCLYLWLLLALGFADALWLRLPDPLTASLAAVAFAMAVLPGGQGLAPAGLGAVIGVTSFALLRTVYTALRGREGLGLGDVKLMAGLGAATGPADLPLLVLIAAGGLLIFILLGQLWRRTPWNGETELPLGTALCAAGAVLWLTGPVLSGG